MTKPLTSELRGALPAWLLCVLIPLPAIVFWRFLGGEPVAHSCFFVCCLGLVASRFRRQVLAQQPPHPWHLKMLAVAVALISAALVFSLLWRTLADAHDLVTPFIAFQALIPAFGIVPYLTLITRKPAAAVVLSAFLVGCMKMIAGIVVNLVHGWNYGHHELPWTDPNLMLWAFWVATAILSVSLFVLGVHEYRAQLDRTAF
jgi:hypothetical protein